MMLSGTEVAVFCVWVDGAHFYVREVEYDKERAELIDYKTREFQQICIAGKQIMDIVNNPESHEQFDEYTAMLDNIAPESTHLDDEQSLSRELFPESDGLVKGDEKDFRFLLDYNQAHESIKVLEDSKQLAKNNILALMKDAEVLEFNDGKVTWRRADGKRDYFQIKINK
jgi:predicted phage-related endonuclease